ncbi:MAG TPA: hypothetical protein EYP08_02100 [Pyrodictiaceae archaeon]|nr:hypothetical protein [Pyrodictiaceae archaeon]HIP85232.1 hypothetical protein [Pyrodictium sp.]HIQ56102.1 hypothetical protein [Pyrodictium sp.]
MAVRRLDEYFKMVGRAVRSGEVDVDLLLHKIVEALMFEIRRIVREEVETAIKSVGVKEVSTSIDIEQVYKKLNTIEKMLVELRAAIDRFEKKTTGIQRQQSKPVWLSRILEAISNRGFVFLRETGVKASVLEPSVLQRHGLATINLGDDYLIVEAKMLQELVDYLSTIKTFDEQETMMKLPHKHQMLFQIFRKAGLVIYNSSKRVWEVSRDVIRFIEQS